MLRAEGKTSAGCQRHFDCNWVTDSEQKHRCWLEDIFENLDHFEVLYHYKGASSWFLDEVFESK